MRHFVLFYDYVPNVVDAAAVEQFVSLDPCVAGGIVTAWRVEPWAVVD